MAELNLRMIEKFIKVIKEETGFSVFVSDENGYIIRATNKYRIGEFHSHAEAIMNGPMNESAVTAEKAAKYPMLEEEYLCAIYYNNRKTATFGIIGNLEIVKPIAKIANRMIDKWLKEFEYQEKLKRSEKKFKHIFNNLQDVYFETTLGGVIKTSSPSGATFSGYSMDEIIGHRVDKLYHNPNDREILLKKIRKNGSIRDLKMLFKKKNGEKYTVSINADLVLDRDGTPLGLRGTIRDITKQIEIDRKVYENEEKFRLIFENSPVGILHFDKKGHITECNDILIETLGSPQEKIIGIDMFTLPDKRIARTLNVVLNKGQSTFFEGEYTTKLSQKTISIRSMFGPIFSEKGNIDGGLCIVEDITQRLASAKKLKNTKHLNNEIIQSLPGLFYIFGEKERKFLIRNKNWNTVTGYSDEELDNMIIHDFFSHGKDQKKCIQKVKEVFKLGLTSMENNLLTKNRKKIPYLFTGAKMHIEGNIYLAGLGIDITDRKKAEQKLIEINETLDIEVKKRTKALKQLNEHLVHSEEKTRINLANDLHDTAVQSIAMSLSKVKMIKKVSSKEVEISLSDIQDYLNQAIDELRLLIYQLSPAVLKDFEIDIALGFLIEEHNKKFQTNLVYHNKRQGNIFMPDANKVTIYRAVNELIMNVTKHSGTNKAEIILSNDKKNIFIVVKDQGKGFDVNAYDKAQFGGFGLYSLSERFRNMDGSVKVNSLIGEGSSISLTAPINTS